MRKPIQVYVINSLRQLEWNVEQIKRDTNRPNPVRLKLGSSDKAVIAELISSEKSYYPNLDQARRIFEAFNENRTNVLNVSNLEIRQLCSEMGESGLQILNQIFNLLDEMKGYSNEFSSLAKGLVHTDKYFGYKGLELAAVMDKMHRCFAKYASLYQKINKPGFPLEFMKIKLSDQSKNLQSYLMEPIQRTMRYPMLFKALKSEMIKTKLKQHW